MRAYVATPGFEAALSAELGASGVRVIVPGVVAADDEAAGAGPVDPTFARQLLPAAVEVTGASVRALAEAAYAAVEGAIDRWPGGFTVHALTPPTPPADDAPTMLPGARAAHTRARQARLARHDVPSAATPSGARDGGLGSRVTLVERELLSILAERRKRASRRHDPSVAPAAFDARLLLVQLLLVTRDRLVVSAAAPRPLPRGGFDLAPWPAGAPPVDDDRAPPSRAYRKLEEAFQWMGAAPRTNETCVDLGAAPGSWTMMAARRGARVFAVDRAPLAPAARQGAVTSVSGDAFTYEPPRPVDWLLCDIICEPPRAITLIDDWLTAKRCRNLVVTIKFKGRAHYAALAPLAAIFDRTRPTFARIKHLAHNKNEVTVMVRVR
ncbi:MAG TPA: SAM-dependent methyltransferase [Polyangia bacterium]|nr:SAM-dependent methyltransferase [Polyangia bacterium]